MWETDMTCDDIPTWHGSSSNCCHRSIQPVHQLLIPLQLISEMVETTVETYPWAYGWKTIYATLPFSLPGSCFSSGCFYCPSLWGSPTGFCHAVDWHMVSFVQENASSEEGTGRELSRFPAADQCWEDIWDRKPHHLPRMVFGSFLSHMLPTCRIIEPDIP